jgi:hypothetical protein
VSKVSTFDAGTIRAAHQKNIVEGTAQIELCSWIGERVSTVRKVVVSGVWHPGTTMGKALELSSEFIFLDPLIIDD